MANLQMIPTSAAPAMLNCYGRVYTAVIGSTPLTVPEQDQAILSANGWVAVSTAGAGSTAQRPTAVSAGATFFDSTVGVLLVNVGKGRWARHDTGALV
jgi:hypothetical protein